MTLRPGAKRARTRGTGADSLGAMAPMMTVSRQPLPSVTDRPHPSAPKGVALFDLDGTLLAWDCQLLFRHFVVRREPWRAVFLPLFLAFLPLAPCLGADGLKRVFLAFLSGVSSDRLADLAREFARAVVPSVYPVMREAIARHREAGDLLVLASASPECYVREIGRELGFDLALGTILVPGGLFPDLENHKGEAKVRRLREALPASYFDPTAAVAWHGYTDSSADLPMLGLCRSATLVNPAARLATLGRAAGWSIVRPVRPWRGRVGFAWRALALLTGLGRDPAGLGRVKG